MKHLVAFRLFIRTPKRVCFCGNLLCSSFAVLPLSCRYLRFPRYYVQVSLISHVPCFAEWVNFASTQVAYALFPRNALSFADRTPDVWIPDSSVLVLFRPVCLCNFAGGHLQKYCQDWVAYLATISDQNCHWTCLTALLRILSAKDYTL